MEEVYTWLFLDILILAAAEASERRFFILADNGFDFTSKCIPDALDSDNFFPLAMIFTPFHNSYFTIGYGEKQEKCVIVLKISL